MGASAAAATGWASSEGIGGMRGEAIGSRASGSQIATESTETQPRTPTNISHPLPHTLVARSRHQRDPRVGRLGTKVIRGDRIRVGGLLSTIAGISVSLRWLQIDNDIAEGDHESDGGHGGHRFSRGRPGRVQEVQEDGREGVRSARGSGLLLRAGRGVEQHRRHHQAHGRQHAVALDRFPDDRRRKT